MDFPEKTLEVENGSQVLIKGLDRTAMLNIVDGGHYMGSVSHTACSSHTKGLLIHIQPGYHALHQMAPVSTCVCALLLCDWLHSHLLLLIGE